MSWKKKLGRNGLLSGSSIRKHMAVIRGSLQEALKKNLIAYNPADRVTLPRKEKYVGKAYTTQEANRLLEIVKDEPIEPAVILGLFYGLRRSEALGLRWQDIDFENDTIQIRHTVVKCTTLIIEDNTKSQSSRRTLDIIPSTKKYFKDLRKRQIENRLLYGSEYCDTDYVCVWFDGKPLSPDYVTQKLGGIGITSNKNGFS